MPLKMTELDIAEWILDILVKDLRLQSGDTVPDQSLKEKYRARGGDGADIKTGLQYAEVQEWLVYDSQQNAWRLTELGHQYP